MKRDPEIGDVLMYVPYQLIVLVVNMETRDVDGFQRRMVNVVWLNDTTFKSEITSHYIESWREWDLVASAGGS